MPKEFTQRRPGSYLPEQQYLTEQMQEIERGLGRVAARLGQHTPITSSLDALDRARELSSDLGREVVLRPLPEAIDERLAWLDRAEERQGRDDGEPTNQLHSIPLDRVILKELRAGWEARRV